MSFPPSIDAAAHLVHCPEIPILLLVVLLVAEYDSMPQLFCGRLAHNNKAKKNNLKK